jgi:hypothetical protein
MTTHREHPSTYTYLCTSPVSNYTQQPVVGVIVWRSGWVSGADESGVFQDRHNTRGVEIWKTKPIYKCLHVMKLDETLCAFCSQIFYSCRHFISTAPVWCSSMTSDSPSSLQTDNEFRSISRIYRYLYCLKSSKKYLLWFFIDDD